MSKRSFMLIFYASSGLFLFILMFLTLHTYLFQMKIETAVVNITLLPLNSTLPGIISEITVENNSEVKKGALLATIENVDLQKEMALTQLNTKDALLAFELTKHLLNNEQKRLFFYKSVSENRLMSLDAEVNNACLFYLAAQKNMKRMGALHKKHYLSTAEWDKIIENFHSASNQLKVVKAQRELENYALRAVQDGLYFTGNKLEGREKDLVAEIEAAKKRLALQQEKVKIYKELQNKLTITAPFDAKVIQVLRGTGSLVDNNKPILLLAPHDAKKNIIVYLTQNEITHVQLNRQVKVYFPAVNQFYLGKVTEINRTAGFVDEMHAVYRARDLYADRTAMVTVEIQDNKSDNFQQYINAGLPAIVYFPRKWFTLF